MHYLKIICYTVLKMKHPFWKSIFHHMCSQIRLFASEWWKTMPNMIVCIKMFYLIIFFSLQTSKTRHSLLTDMCITLSFSGSHQNDEKWSIMFVYIKMHYLNFCKSPKDETPYLQKYSSSNRGVMAEALRIPQWSMQIAVFGT